MSWLTLTAVILSHTFVATMLLRTAYIVADARLFYRVFKANNYPACVGCLLLMRVIIPAYLGAPLLLWMDSYSFFRRMTMHEAHDLGRQLMLIYGPDPVAEEPQVDTPQELTEVNRDLK